MSRFLVEVGHEPAEVACARARQVFLTSGSHFLTHALWGCLDGVHTAWIIMEADSKEEAGAVVPPAFRSRSRIVGLNEWGLEHLDELLEAHRQ